MKTTTLGTGAALLAIAFVATGPAAYAAEGDVEVVNTETIQVYVSSEGDIESQRVYEQLSLTGSGSVELANPIEESGLRNLDGFSGLSVEDGVQNVAVDVDGVERLRSVSDYEGDLPLDVSVEYRLDGARVNPSDVVGAEGELEVLYTVKNVTAKPQEVTFTDGNGGTVTETVDVPIPMVGSLSTVAPPNFTDVRSEQANMAGDGKGGTRMSFTMTLFPPLGSDEVQFGYAATVDDAVVPPSTISALPVNPLESTSFKTAGESYQSGSDTGVRLAEGATEIDANLLKLQDGAATLLAGLIQLSDGADQLNAGLAGEAAPGAVQLADGAVVLKDGLSQIDDGAGRLSDGAGRLSAGQDALEGGLRTLYEGVNSLPKSVRTKLRKNAEYNALKDALTAVSAGVGTRMDGPTAETLLGGLNAVQYGMRFPGGYSATDCGLALTGGTPSQCGAMDGVQFVAEQLAQGATDLNQLKPVLTGLNIANACPGAPDNYLPPPNPPTNECQMLATLYYALFGTGIPPVPAGAQVKVNTAAAALQGIQQKVQAQLLGDGAGLDKLRFGLSNPAAGNCLTAKQTATPADDCGIKEASLFLRGVAIPALVDGITASVRSQLLKGIGQPAAGCDPKESLRCAAAALAAGGAELQTGAGQLADGTGEASDGSQRLADGAGELSDGLGDAADGSSRLADGMAEAADGAPQIVDGAGRLSEEGMSQLIGAGEDTAQDYGKLYATIAAGGERADAEKMAYGAPADATGVTAYTYELLGDDGEGGRNLKRGLGGLALLGLGGLAFGLRRRFV